MSNEFLPFDISAPYHIPFDVIPPCCYQYLPTAWKFSMRDIASMNDRLTAWAAAYGQSLRRAYDVPVCGNDPG
jgi:hypothetical protein